MLLTTVADYRLDCPLLQWDTLLGCVLLSNDPHGHKKYLVFGARSADRHGPLVESHSGRSRRRVQEVILRVAVLHVGVDMDTTVRWTELPAPSCVYEDGSQLTDFLPALTGAVFVAVDTETVWMFGGEHEVIRSQVCPLEHDQVCFVSHVGEDHHLQHMDDGGTCRHVFMYRYELRDNRFVQFSEKRNSACKLVPTVLGAAVLHHSYLCMVGGYTCTVERAASSNYLEEAPVSAHMLRWDVIRELWIEPLQCELFSVEVMSVQPAVIVSVCDVLLTWRCVPGPDGAAECRVTVFNVEDNSQYSQNSVLVCDDGEQLLHEKIISQRRLWWMSSEQGVIGVIFLETCQDVHAWKCALHEHEHTSHFHWQYSNLIGSPAPTNHISSITILSLYQQQGTSRTNANTLDTLLSARQQVVCDGLMFYRDLAQCRRLRPENGLPEVAWLSLDARKSWKMLLFDDSVPQLQCLSLISSLTDGTHQDINELPLPTSVRDRLASGKYDVLLRDKINKKKKLQNK